MSTKSLPKIIAIVGPTTSGKTDLGIYLAKKFNGEIISADSRQIYKGMDIGTAKASVVKKGTRWLAEGIPHHLVNILNPNKNFSAAEFKRLAIKTAKDILSRGKIPFLVGGTGLYIKAAVENLNLPRVKPDPALRKNLEEQLKKEGLSSLAARLKEIDPEASYVVDLKNPRRVIRALEIALSLKKPLASARAKGPSLFDALQIGIRLPKEILRERIDANIEKMFKEGLVREVTVLLKKYPATLPALSAIGYREVIPLLAKKTNIEEVKRLMKKNTWAYAKRQMTWFRAQKNILWTETEEEAKKLVAEFLGK